MAGLSVIAAAALGVWFLFLAGEAWGATVGLILLHALALLVALFRFRRRHEHSQRIDGMMMLALSYVLWFSIVPLILVLN